MNEITALKVTEIMIDPALEARPPDPDYIRRLEEALQLNRDLKPLLVWKTATGHVLLGGNQRLEALKRHYKGVADLRVRCQVVECKSFKEALRAAYIDNRDHGKPLSDAQRIEKYLWLTRHEKWTVAEACEVLNLSEEHLRRLGGRKSEPTGSSQPNEKSEPMITSHPKVSSEPDATSAPEVNERAEEHKSPMLRERSSLPTLAEVSILQHIKGLVAHSGYRATKHTQQALLSLKSWIREALS